MANEIRVYHASSRNLYFCIFDTSGNVWYVAGDAFEAWGTSGRDADDYDIALTDKSGSLYLGSFDTGISSGIYYIIFYRRAGANPADGDYAVGHEEGYWDAVNSIWYTLAVSLHSILSNTGSVLNVYPTGAKTTITGGAIMGVEDEKEIR